MTCSRAWGLGLGHKDGLGGLATMGQCMRASVPPLDLHRPRHPGAEPRAELSVSGDGAVPHADRGFQRQDRQGG